MLVMQEHFHLNFISRQPSWVVLFALIPSPSALSFVTDQLSTTKSAEAESMSSRGHSSKLLCTFSCLGESSRCCCSSQTAWYSGGVAHGYHMNRDNCKPSLWEYLVQFQADDQTSAASETAQANPLAKEARFLAEKRGASLRNQGIQLKMPPRLSRCNNSRGRISIASCLMRSLPSPLIADTL